MENYLLRTAKTTEEKIANVVLGFGAVSLYIYIVRFFFKSLEYTTLSQALFSSSLVGSILFSVVIAPIWEELIFRKSLVKITKYLPSVYLLPILLGTSCLFGWLHGSVMNVFFQGAIGFVIACVYVKNGYCYRSAVILHALWNGMLVLQNYI